MGDTSPFAQPVIDGKKRPRLVIRTIREGAVWIFGRRYVPRPEPDLPYDGRLNGQRFAFGLYHGDPSHVSLWGTERAYRAGPDPFVDWPGPNCIDGELYWQWWTVDHGGESHPPVEWHGVFRGTEVDPRRTP